MAANPRLENLSSAIFESNQKVALKNELLENLKSDFFAQADILKQLLNNKKGKSIKGSYSRKLCSFEKNNKKRMFKCLILMKRRPIFALLLKKSLKKFERSGRLATK